jgi:uncharacterized membrane protein
MRSWILPLAIVVAACSSKPANQASRTSTGVPTDRLLEGKEAEEALQLPVVTALGTEPFWSVLAEKGTLSWTSPDEPIARTVTAKPIYLHRGRAFNGTLDGKPFELLVINAKCSDGMSDRVYPMHARVTKGGQEFRGCAYEGKRTPP